MHRTRSLWAGLLLVGVGILLILLAWPRAKCTPMEEQSASAPASPTPEPLVPTRTPTGGTAAVTSVVRRMPAEAAVETSPTATVVMITRHERTVAGAAPLRDGGGNRADFAV